MATQLTLAIRRVPAARPGYLRLGARALALALVLAVSVSSQTTGEARQFRQASAPYSLDLVSWEATHLLGRVSRVARSLSPGPVTIGENERTLLRSYFQTADESTRRALRPSVEAAIERGLTAVLLKQELVPLSPWLPQPLVFPPVSLAITAPPKVLVLSPRDQLSLERTQLLQPTVDWPEASRIEAGIDDADTVSLVVPIGGLATYPSMVVDATDARTVLESAAHEWVHAYLFFTPLGQRYWSDPQARALNETVADSAGRELAAQLGQELGLVEQAATARQPAGRSSFDLRQALRETRQEVERLLAAGRVAEAEAYMEQRRDFIAQHGYTIRKLNQAYFAFHGNYAESGAAGVNPIAPLVRALRGQSASLGDFLWRAGQFTSLAAVAEAVGQPADGPRGVRDEA